MNSFKRFQSLAFGVFFLLSFLLLVYILRPFLHVIILAGITAFFLAPLYRQVQKWISEPVRKAIYFLFRKQPSSGGSPGSIAALITVLLFLVIVLISAVFLIQSLAQQAALLYSLLTTPESLEKVQNLWEKLFTIRFLNISLREMIPGIDISTLGMDLARKISGFLYNQLTGLISFTFQSVFNLIIYLLVTFSLLRFPESVFRFFLVLSPMEDSYDEILISSVRESIKSIFYGNGIASLIQGFLGGLLFWIFGLNAPLFWGVIMVIFAFIPVLGILFIGVPAALWLVFAGSLWKGILLAILFLLVYFPVEWNLKSKLIAGKSPSERSTQSIYSVLTLLTILGGINAFGILGIIYGPVILALFASIFRIYQEITRAE